LHYPLCYGGIKHREDFCYMLPKLPGNKIANSNITNHKTPKPDW